MKRLISMIVALTVPASAVLAGAPKYKKHVLGREFYTEGCTVADLNKDGKIDVVAGPLWYEAPDWKPREVREPGKFNWDGGYSKSFANFALDVNQDGWTDVIIVGFPGEETFWYENPKGSEGHWKQHLVFRSTTNESPQGVDVNKDDKLDMVFGYSPEDQMAWFAPPKEKGGTEWTRYPISKEKAPGTHRFWHGLGVGDINGDGRNDVVIRVGWWEAPEDITKPDWTFHEAKLGEDFADMIVQDVDGDGDNDVISSSAHKYGLWWHEQGKDADGRMTWTTHVIQEKLFSQSHAMVAADINGDGLPDFVTGKRFWAHNGKDPGEKEPAVLYWFELSRKDGKPNWTPHLIDEDSGIGTQFVVQDINGDKTPDIITANKKATFVFLSE